MVHRELAAQDMLQGVGERTVADIVEEARRLDELSLFVRQAERPRHLSRDEAYAEAMLDPRMIRPREHEIRQAELSNRIESLQLERFEEVEGERIEADRPVDGVRDRLQIRHPTHQPMPSIYRFGETVRCIICRIAPGLNERLETSTEVRVTLWTIESSQGPEASG